MDKLMVTILTAPADAPDGVKPESKRVDLRNRSDRKWFDRHFWWAMNNGHTVVTIPEAVTNITEVAQTRAA